MKIRETLLEYYKVQDNVPISQELDPKHASYWFREGEIPILEHVIHEKDLKENEIHNKKYLAMYNERDDINDTWPEVIYDLNEQGYRALEFNGYDDYKQQILVLGCSYTFGVGLKKSQIYTHYLQEVFGDNYQIWNCGYPGASNDFIVRLAWRLIPILKPKIVIVQWTMLNRREYITEDGSIKRLMPNHPRYYIDTSNTYKALMKLQNKHWDLYCFEKNLAMMQLLAATNEFAFLWDTMRDFPHVDMSRDNLHPGPVSHKLFAVQLYKQFLDELVFSTNRTEDIEKFLDIVDKHDHNY